MNKLFTILLASLIFILSGETSLAYEEAKVAPTSTATIEAQDKDNTPPTTTPIKEEIKIFSSLGMVTGSPTGTYYRFGHDIKSALKADGVEIDVKESKGSITNLKRIGSNENAAFGIVQSDVLGFLSNSKRPESQELASHLRMVFPFYQEEVHIIANKSIATFKDLNKKNIVVGPTGSGSWLTAMNMFSLTSIRPHKLRRLSPEEGLKAVLTGEADAMIFVAGKPVTLFQTLDKLSETPKYSSVVSNVHFVPIQEEVLLKEYSTSVLSANDYKIITTDVPTIAVSAILVSYDFSTRENEYANARCDEIGYFSAALLKNIKSLKANGHPKWQEVDLDAEVGSWKRDKCSSMASSSAGLENEFLDELQMKW